MNFSEKRSCSCQGVNGIVYDECILIYKDDEVNRIGWLFFSGSIVRFVDDESSYDYTATELTQIVEKMKGN